MIFGESKISIIILKELLTSVLHNMLAAVAFKAEAEFLEVFNTVNLVDNVVGIISDFLIVVELFLEEVIEDFFDNWVRGTNMHLYYLTQ